MTSKKLPAILMMALVAPLATAQRAAPEKSHEPAPAAQTAPRSDLTLPVKGLTAENAAKVRSALSALAIETFECLDCGTVRPRAGECGVCETELVSMEQPVFAELRESAEHGTLAFRLAPDAHVRLTTIEKALRAGAVQVQRESLQLGGHVVLVYSGGASAEDAAALQQAFRDAKHDGAQAVFDESTREIHLHLRKGSPSWSSVSELHAKLGKSLRLADVIWKAGPARIG